MNENSLKKNQESNLDRRSAIKRMAKNALLVGSVAFVPSFLNSEKVMGQGQYSSTCYSSSHASAHASSHYSTHTSSVTTGTNSCPISK